MLNLRSVAVPTKVVLTIYAWVAAAVALLLLIFGPQVFGLAPRDPGWHGTRSNTVITLLILGMACLSAVLGRIPDPLARRRALLGFGAVHLLFGLAPCLWILVTLGDDSRGNSLLRVATGMLIFFTVRWLLMEGPSEKTDRIVTEIFGDPPPQAESPLSVAYEREIREAATQTERNRLARELHDSIKQEIFAMHASAATAQERFDSDPDGARRALEQVRASARDASVEMDALLDQLRATPLSLAGLITALEKQCEALSLRTGAKVTREMGTMPPEAALPPGVTQAFFRIAQEALANIARHARASNVVVSLGWKERRFQLSIEDDGAGFERDRADAGGMGIGNMKARAHDVGGHVVINSAPGKGTKVAAAVTLLPFHGEGWERWWKERTVLSIAVATMVVVLVLALVMVSFGGIQLLYDIVKQDPVLLVILMLGQVSGIWRALTKRR